MGTNYQASLSISIEEGASGGGIVVAERIVEGGLELGVYHMATLFPVFAYLWNLLDETKEMSHRDGVAKEAKIPLWPKLE